MKETKDKVIAMLIVTIAVSTTAIPILWAQIEEVAVASDLPAKGLEMQNASSTLTSSDIHLILAGERQTREVVDRLDTIIWILKNK